uniref:Uncharacterized protein n=1 Tax=Romanomermis culicivorax TaxID=13658 RepID=A0A915L3C2_ROMCU
MRHTGNHGVGKDHWGSIFKWCLVGRQNMQKTAFFGPKVPRVSSMGHTSSTSKNHSKSNYSRKQNDHNSPSSNYSSTTESEEKESNEKLHPPNSSVFSDHRFENENSSENDEYFESVQDMTYYSNYAIHNGKDIRYQCDKRDYKLTNHNFGFPNHVNRFYLLEQDCSGDKTTSNDGEEKFQQQDRGPFFRDHNDERQNIDCDKNHDEQNTLSVHSKTSHTQSSLHDSDTLFDFGLLSDHDKNVASSARFDSGKREIQFDHFEKVRSKPAYKISNLRRKPACRIRFFTPKYGVNWSEFQRNVNFTASMTNKRKNSILSRCTTDCKPDQLTENDEPYVLECRIWGDKKDLAEKWSCTV